jgi:hypothetical protein
LRLFAFRLALALGVWDVDAMLDDMPGDLLYEWLAYYQIDPFGNERGDLQSAMIVSALANIHRDPKTQRKPYQPGDFMPQFDSQPSPRPSPNGRGGGQTVEQQLEIVRMLNAALGGSEVKHE